MNETIRTAAISPLRQRLINDMNMRRFSRATQQGCSCCLLVHAAHARSTHGVHIRLPHHLDLNIVPHPRHFRSAARLRGGSEARSASRMARSALGSDFQFFFLLGRFPRAD